MDLFFIRAGALALAVGTAVAPAAATTFEVTGRVRAAEGAGLSGATVELLPVADGYREALRQWRGERAVPAARAVADRDGFYSLRAPGPGMWRVVARAPGRIAAGLPPLPLVEPITLPPVGLAIALEAMLRVVYAAGRPVAGARIESGGAERSFRESPSLWSPEREPLVSDAGGQVRLSLGERLKAEVPIWKREHYAGGEAAWREEEPLAPRA